MDKHSKKRTSIEKPLFTGNSLRDSSVTEFEKLAEASYYIRCLIEKRIQKKNSKKDVE